MFIKTHLIEQKIKGAKRDMTGKVVLLHSGGADSTASALILKELGLEVIGLFIDYNQPNADAEYLAACRTAKSLEFNVTMMSLKGITEKGPWMNDNNAFVPCRNTLFMVIAGSVAERLDADGIAIGFMLDDIGVFGDNDSAHHAMVEALLTQSLSRPMKVLTPISQFTKLEVMDMLKTSNLLDSTVSCWNAVIVEGEIKTCGECAQCLERQK